MYIRIKNHVVEWVTPKGHKNRIDLVRGIYPLMITLALSGLLWIFREEPITTPISGLEGVWSLLSVVLSLGIFFLVFMMIRTALIELSSDEEVEE